MVGKFEIRMTWLISGASGQLGESLKTELVDAGIDFVSFSREEFDIENKDMINFVFRKYSPRIVVNCAAWTDVQSAERNFDKVMSINAHAISNLANASKSIGAVFIQISTDYVFDGLKNKPYQTSDVTNPLNVYGYSKDEGEKSALRIYSEGTYIFRTAWLYSEFGNNFVKKMVKNASLEIESHVVNDQFGQPTSAKHLAKQIVLSVYRRIPFGIYHATNSGKTSWFGLASNVYLLLGKPTNLVVPKETNFDQEIVLRPEFTVLSHKCWPEVELDPMMDWANALEMELPNIFSKMKNGG
jgi:dTDP-4-dehydrorhamnose reductase